MASRSSYPIADASSPITSNGSFPDTGVPWQGGVGSLQVFGTFGGGTARLQMVADDKSTLLDLGSGVVFVANGVNGFFAPPCTLFLLVSGATSPSLKASIAQMS